MNKLASKGSHGILLGGNFTLIKSFFATKYESDDSDKIPILEDVGVSFRALDRSLHQLLYKNPFNAKAIIFGQFYPLDPTDEQRLMYKTVIERFAEKINKPVYYFPFFGHGRKNKPPAYSWSRSLHTMCNVTKLLYFEAKATYTKPYKRLYLMIHKKNTITLNDSENPQLIHVRIIH